MNAFFFQKHERRNMFERQSDNNMLIILWWQKHKTKPAFLLNSQETYLNDKAHLNKTVSDSGCKD